MERAHHEMPDFFIFVHFDQTKNDVMGGACNTHGSDE
jgi:hypothetical protein